MLDIKGQQVNIGDKVLFSNSYGLSVAKYKKDSKTRFVFDNGQTLPRMIKGQWMGYDDIDDATGLAWDYSWQKPAKNVGKLKRVYKGDNGTGYKLVDASIVKQTRILKVDDNFEL